MNWGKNLETDYNLETERSNKTNENSSQYSQYYHETNTKNPLNNDQISRNLRKFNIEINLYDYDPKIFRYIDQRIILITLQTKVYYKPGSETFCITYHKHKTVETT